MFAKIVSALILPKQISDFEVSYLRRINRVALLFFAGHIPAFMLVAFFNDTNPGLAFVLTSLVMAGPMLAYKTFDNPRSVSLVYGFTSMLMGGLLVHFGQGPVQIEMHFYFFALLAMLSVFGNPMAILVAAVTVAVHHLLLWAVLPRSVFNYDAPIWVVLVHAGFVVLESVATCFVARSFFDNVIGLEKIVQSRTLQLDARNRDMRLVLDNASEGFLTIDRGAVMSTEKSAILETWFGPTTTDPLRLPDYFASIAPDFASSLELAWAALIEDVLPLELTLYQLPKAFSCHGKHYHVDWTPILRQGALEKVLVMISDVSAEYLRERLEGEQRDVLKILGRVAHDKQGVLEFFDEARDLVATITDERVKDLVLLRRAVHTLKGNSLIFGVQTVADACHRMESQIDEVSEPPSAEERADLRTRWDLLCTSIDTLLGTSANRTIEIDDDEYAAILHCVLRGEPHHKVASMIQDWRLEPTRKRLNRVAEQAQSLAKRLGRGAIEVHVADHGLRLDAERWAAFWAAFVHVLRNAVDHGLEPSDTRLAAGKAVPGSIELSTRLDGDEFVIELGDNGRGIDWEAVAGKAHERGLAYSTPAELTEALFVDGLSTKDEVNEFSGRGVGMGAVRQACAERGGRVSVDSQRGVGTRVQFRFPRASMFTQQELRATG